LAAERPPEQSTGGFVSMIDRGALLSDLQSVLKTLEADLLERSESDELPGVVQTLQATFEAAKNADRTAQSYEQWRTATITQTAAAWVLSCTFVRFLEDNRLTDPPRISGPDERRQHAQNEHQLYFQNPDNARKTDREYLLQIFEDLSGLPGTRDLFGKHNPINELPNWLSGDAAKVLLEFFQKIEADTGDLVHDFTDPEWGTRFLGDLYQDLSEEARKRFALLQTPDFVEKFILDRTLDPALDEFGVDAAAITDAKGNETVASGFRMIDPACGSGHFLLGTFDRLLARWQQKEPNSEPATWAQRALDSIHGVDINPFAVAITRFRLLLAALKACGIERLNSAPDFKMNLACGDSLYHGGERQKHLGDWSDEAHYFQSEDAAELRRMLREGSFHAVVANPPYIVPKDRAANQAYRRLYSSCHMKYSLAVPFMERIFRLAIRTGDDGQRAGYTGQITTNAFMKREYGKKLIEEFLPTVDLTHVIDTSGTYIPGHGTPTVILFGRNRRPVAEVIRTVMGIRGEPSTPDDPSQGKVWTAITDQVDQPGSESEFVSVGDTERDRFATHPWSIGGGGAAELKERLDGSGERTLGADAEAIGPMAMTMLDEVYLAEQHVWRKHGVPVRPYVTGDSVRDWSCESQEFIANPYDDQLQVKDLQELENLVTHLWPYRPSLSARLMFGKTPLEAGLRWHEYRYIEKERAKCHLLLAFACVATHNHFHCVRVPVVANRHAPVIKLPPEATEDDHLGLLGLLNSSTACFWMKQVFYPKATSTGDISSEKGRPEANRYEFAGTGLSGLPIPFRSTNESLLVAITRKLDTLTSQLQDVHPSSIVAAWSCNRDSNLAATLKFSERQYKQLKQRMIALQEELDWETYHLYGLSSEGGDLQVVEGDDRILESDRPYQWEGDDAPSTLSPSLVSRYTTRRQLAKSGNLSLIESPVFKRPWWGRQGVYGRLARDYHGWTSEALKSWLLDRLESYFDFDGRMNDEGSPTSQIDIGLVSVAHLADIASRDSEFQEVGSVYRDDEGFDLPALVEELVRSESVPLLPVLRYKPAGLRKRKEWEQTWELQREEDTIDARTELPKDDPDYLSPLAAEELKAEKIGDIPVPPKYKSAEFINAGGARYWALRGKLDVPKERWTSFPHCEGTDGTLVICWAGYDHLQQAKAISAHYMNVKDNLGGRDDPRLVPLLACLIELLPWLKQWHNEIDPEFDLRMGDYFEGFIQDEARGLNMSLDEINSWEAPAKQRKRKKSTEV
jgi:hypothetical protein